MSNPIASYDDGMQIVPFDPALKDEFRRLNVAWLTRYFRVEPIDEQVLGNPEAEIIASGGEVLFARWNGLVVGTVALKSEQTGVFEVTKMAVDEPWQGRGFGRRLLEAAIHVARERGATNLILYSQRSLAAALHLYRRCGFVEIQLCGDQRYSRCDIKMQLAL
jgi:GNAT superfamily N-acetyltransferase